MSKFKVTLNLEADEELRAYVKDLIKGQVISLTREDVRGIFLKELVNPSFQEAGLKELFLQKAKEMLEETFKKKVSNYSSDTAIEAYIKATAKEEVQRIIKEKLAGLNLTI